jgi:probable F420-dependent oxidoreductase
MQIGIACAQIGQLADPAAVRATALAAESVGYSSLWVLDRLLAPVEPRTGYAGIEGMPLPVGQDRALDPFAVLASAAAVTSRVRLGTSVLVAPWYPPAVLARLLTSLDVLSEGRLVVGLGTGWSVDEYEAAGAEMGRRGRDLDAALDVLDAAWGDGEFAYDGHRAHIVPSKKGLRPVQRPRPPVILAAYTPAAIDRVARRADGWMPAGFEVDTIAPVWAQIRDLAAGYGRDPDAMRLVVRANVYVTEQPQSERMSYLGSMEQVIEDVLATEAAGADEILLDLNGDPSLDTALDVYARIAEAVGTRTPASVNVEVGV